MWKRKVPLSSSISIIFIKIIFWKVKVYVTFIRWEVEVTSSQLPFIEMNCPISEIQNIEIILWPNLRLFTHFGRIWTEQPYPKLFSSAFYLPSCWFLNKQLIWYVENNAYFVPCVAASGIINKCFGHRSKSLQFFFQ